MTTPGLRRFLPIFLSLFVCLGLFVRLTVRDRYAAAGTVFYASPWPVLVLVSGLSALLWHRAGWRRLSLGCLAGVLLMLGWWVHVGFVWNAWSPPDSGPRVLFWNVSRGWGGWAGLGDRIRQADADIIGLVEVNDPDGQTGPFLRTALPGYEVSSLQWGIGLATRGHIERSTEIRLGPHGKCRHFQLALPQHRADVVVVDFRSNPFRSRRQRFDELNRLLDSLSDRPVILMGDFNTPVDSVFFEPLRARFANAFAAAGRGLQATWPVLLPVLAIDQIWVDRRLGVWYCDLGWSLRSDHRPVMVECRWPAQGADKEGTSEDVPY